MVDKLKTKPIFVLMYFGSCQSMKIDSKHNSSSLPSPLKTSHQRRITDVQFSSNYKFMLTLSGDRVVLWTAVDRIVQRDVLDHERAQSPWRPLKALSPPRSLSIRCVSFFFLLLLVVVGCCCYCCCYCCYCCCHANESKFVH